MMVDDGRPITVQLDGPEFRIAKEVEHRLEGIQVEGNGLVGRRRFCAAGYAEALHGDAILWMGRLTRGEEDG
jgi:hypothetical protein